VLAWVRDLARRRNSLFACRAGLGLARAGGGGSNHACRVVRGSVRRAAQIFAELLRQDPADVTSIEGRIRALLRSQRHRSALDEARGHAETHADRPRVLAVLAEALFRAGRFEEIEPLIGPLAQRDDAPARALAVLARLYGAEGRAKPAVTLMARAVESAPDDRDVLYWASGFAETRARSVDLLERYLVLAEGDDPDRIEATRSGIEVLRALEERAIWVSEQRPERTEIPLTRIWDPSSGVTQGFVIRVGLGPKGKPTPLLLDSGSPGLFVIQRVARKRGFEKLAVQSQFGGGGNQRHHSARGTFATVTIGDLRFRTALASSNKQEMDPVGRYHGLIGLSVFNGYRITLDLVDERLILEPPDPAAAGEPYWTVEGQWLVRGTLGAIDGLLLFDSGATHSAGCATRAGNRGRVPGTAHGEGSAQRPGPFHAKSARWGRAVGFCGPGSVERPAHRHRHRDSPHRRPTIVVRRMLLAR